MRYETQSHILRLLVRVVPSERSKGLIGVRSIGEGWGAHLNLTQSIAFVLEHQRLSTVRCFNRHIFYYRRGCHSSNGQMIAVESASVCSRCKDPARTADHEKIAPLTSTLNRCSCERARVYY